MLPERGWWPAVALGMQDVGGGTGLFSAPYGVLSKRLGELDLTLGYGSQRIDGVFGGVRWSPRAFERWSLVAEYDAYDYKNDHRRGSLRRGELQEGGRAAASSIAAICGARRRSSRTARSASTPICSIPLEQREFVPKVNEPAPYTKINPRPTEAQWHEDPGAPRAARRGRWCEQGFRDISLGYTHGRLEAMLTNTRISSMPRAIGRAARTMLSFAPLEVREVRITYKQGPLPIATYKFINTPLLRRYFNGMATREKLAPYVAIDYAAPLRSRGDEERDRPETLAAFEEPLPEGIVVQREGADLFALRGENVLGGRLRVRPGFSVFFNDPSGAFRYEICGRGDATTAPSRASSSSRREVKLTLLENVSDVTQPSNSLLPHVRSDVAEYRKGSDFKLTRLLVNRFYHPATARLRARLGGPLRGDVRRRRRAGAVSAADGDWAVDTRGRLGAAARLRGRVRLPGLQHRHRDRLAQLPHGAGRHRHRCAPGASSRRTRACAWR